MLMILDLTQEELTWRFGMLKDELENYLDSEIYVTPDDDINNIFELDSAALLYMILMGHAAFKFHNGKDSNVGAFTVTKAEYLDNAWVEPDEGQAFNRPSKREIPVPNLFDDPENSSYSQISLIFDFPNSKIGDICKKFVGHLREWCYKDIYVINMAVFCASYVKDISTASRLLRLCLVNAFTESWLVSLQQTPSEVEEVIDFVLEAPSSSVYDPFMRSGYNLFFAEDNYIGQGESKYHVYATMFFASLWGKSIDCIYHESCIQNWIPGDCDTIIATPDFSMQIDLQGNATEPVGMWLLKKLCSSMGPRNRRALTILPATILNASGSYEAIRHDMVESNLLDTVVLLPANLFPRTGIPTAIILLKSGRNSDSPITLADFSSLVKERKVELSGYKPELDTEKIKQIIDSNDSSFIKEVSLDDIRSAEYDLYVPVYFNKNEDIPRGYQKVYLSELMERIDEFECFPSWSNSVMREDSMSTHAFDDDMVLDVLTMEDCENAVINEEDYSFTSCDCVFAMDFNGPLRTAWSQLGDKILSYTAIPNSCYAFSINPDVIDPCYLRMLLHQKFDTFKTTEDDENIHVKKLIHLLYTDTIIPISIEEQKRLYKEAKFNHAIEKARKEGLDEAVERMKQEYMMEVRMRKHDMKPFLSQLDSQAKLITFYLDKIEGNEQVVSAIRSKLTGVSNAVSELRLHLNRLTEEDIYGTPEKLNPLEILNEFVGTFDNYSVELDVDTLALEDAGIAIPYISFCPVDFSTLVGTIKENAVAHAFVDEKQKYHFRISFSYDKAKERYIIDFMNDGKPMPQGMDKFRYGLKGEKGARSQGTGLGGYRVKSIARHYGGDYDVFCNRTQGLVTTIRVELPPYKE